MNFKNLNTFIGGYTSINSVQTNRIKYFYLIKRKTLQNILDYSISQIGIIIFGSVILLSCGSTNKQETLPCNLDQLIKTALQKEPQNPRASIDQYIYHGETVYYIQIGNYPDGMTKIINSNCKTICTFGGIAGLNTCKDFDSKANFIKTIWKDPR